MLVVSHRDETYRGVERTSPGSPPEAEAIMILAGVLSTSFWVFVVVYFAGLGVLMFANLLGGRKR
jgi:hypothetical protein